MPRAADLPDFTSELTEVPAKTNPLGVKGAGEAGATGAPPAIMAAILDALKPLGIEHIDMPATPSRVWAVIKARETKQAA
jgi:carbon-monoxide dehydrogenase large subunit